MLHKPLFIHYFSDYGILLIIPLFEKTTFYASNLRLGYGINKTIPMQNRQA
ncbi:hypothetical protein M2480_001167 [Parabacteroides sp. PFB2-12]|nr:hypothetical protein [Parabacteroides sp. PM6-13]MDH6390197.1 hypothetical protein [Parabacteroides sp. PFB2-12]